MWIFSKFIPSKIIYCSQKSINFHEKKHLYSKNKTRLIYNGFGDQEYFPSEKLRLNFRNKYNIKKSEIIIGYAGRYAKQKNIFSLLKAFSKIIKKEKKIYLYMAGKHMDKKNKFLFRYIENLNLSTKVCFLGNKKFIGVL